jgi:hypothetical protein
MSVKGSDVNHSSRMQLGKNFVLVNLDTPFAIKTDWKVA